MAFDTGVYVNISSSCEGTRLGMWVFSYSLAVFTAKLHSFLWCFDKARIILDHHSVNGRNELYFPSYKDWFRSLPFKWERMILLSHSVRKFDEKIIILIY